MRLLSAVAVSMAGWSQLTTLGASVVRRLRGAVVNGLRRGGDWHESSPSRPLATLDTGQRRPGLLVRRSSFGAGPASIVGRAWRSDLGSGGAASDSVPVA